LPGRFAVIGMGKLGGRELNYSSDIDLLYVYEPDDESDDPLHRVFHRFARVLTGILTEYTDESYLYRLDLRLRPMGRRGNIAYSLDQYRHYYESWGETFERFALIKARHVAGDPELGARFLQMVQPFVYRKYLDHTATEELFRYRQRTDRAQADEQRDVKTGRGGIREIELFAQVLQLTYGASHPDIRQCGTLAALGALERAGLVSPGVRADLAASYEFLRTVEHRLQIVHDQQTHELARADRELAIGARRLGFETARALEEALAARRARVHEIYQGIFDRRPGASDFRSRQFFRVLLDDASEDEALRLVADSGMPDPAAALDMVRALDQAIALAPSRTTARNVLANLIPPLLDRIGRCATPQRVLMRFEQITERTGAPVSFFRRLLENSAFLDLLVATLDLGDLPANRLIRYPELLDTLAVAADGGPIDGDYASRLSELDPDDRARQLRRFKSIEEFKIVARWAHGGSIGSLQEELSDLAETVIADSASRHRPAAENGEQPDWAIFALGKLGGRELTVHSDLDLVVVYRGDPADSETFLARQNFVAAIVRDLEEPTGEGALYQVDTRLRPEGKKGSLAMPFRNFLRYLDERAEIWERLAWTRARFVTGSRSLGAEVTAAADAFVYGPWNPDIPGYVRNLRARMERELTGPSDERKAVEFKIGRGGLADVDFTLQVVQIREGFTRSEFRIAGTRRLLDTLPPTSLLDAADVATLRDAHDFLRRLETLARLASDTHVSALPAVPERLESLGRQMGFGERAGEELLGAIQQRGDAVRTLFETVITRL
jgi:glutamate-ammonia-ligase adenylyltransferase